MFSVPLAEVDRQISVSNKLWIVFLTIIVLMVLLPAAISSVHAQQTDCNARGTVYGIYQSNRVVAQWVLQAWPGRFRYEFIETGSPFYASEQYISHNTYSEDRGVSLTTHRIYHWVTRTWKVNWSEVKFTRENGLERVPRSKTITASVGCEIHSPDFNGNYPQS